MDLVIFTDGGSRGNPGKAACAMVVYSGDKQIFEHGHYLGVATNNVAEYSGLYMATKWLRNFSKETNINSVNFFLDSELVVKQVRGEYKVKNKDLLKLLKKIIEIKDSFDFSVNYKHVLREENKEADALVNKTLDQVSR